MKLRSLLLLCLATLGLGHVGLAAPAAAAPVFAPTLEKAAAELPAGGFVYAEIDGDTVRYGTAGRAAGPAGVAPERVLFEIGSITKVFTGLLLAQATLDGKVALDDPIAKHLPADLSLDPSVAAITLQQLSSHTSGLPRLPDNLAPSQAADPYADYSVERLHRFLRGHRLAQPAPQPAEYSNLAVGLLGHLLARAYGMSYAELVRAKITAPLGLADTVIALDAGQQARFAAPHSGTMTVSPWALASLEGAGALRSTAADMAKFVQALGDDASPIAAAWRIAREPRAPMGARGQVGLGVMMHEESGHRLYHHGGGTGGFRSHFDVTPATKRGTVVLLNNDAPEPGMLVTQARRKATAAAAAATATATKDVAPSANAAAGGTEAKAGAPGAAAATTSPAPAPDLTAEGLRAYTGVYEIDARGRFTAVVDEQGRLRLRLTGQSFLPVEALGGDRFAAKAFGAEFQFARDDAGRVATLTLHQNGREIPARRTADAPAVFFPAVERLKDFEGIYELAPGMVFEVKVAARMGALMVKLTGQPSFPVHNTKPDHFVYDVVDAALTFERDAAGAVTAVILHQNGMDQRAPRQKSAAAK